MKIVAMSVGKLHDSSLKSAINMYSERLGYYFPFSWELIPPPRQAGKMSAEELKSAEGRLVLARMQSSDHLVLLDERGKQLSSPGLSQLINQKANQSVSRLVFLIGGAYGVSEEIQSKANFTWSLSQLVFPHMLVRLILAEQLYRACTIMRNEKYHHS
jgi:23S rRNA (pseudouridine1915-N3)-methyltransferase